MSNFDPPVIAGASWLRALRMFGPGAYGWLFGLLKRATWGWEAPLRELRQELGLPPSNRRAIFEGQFSPLLNLALFDPQLARPQPDWPKNTCVCGSPIFDGTTHDASQVSEASSFLAQGEAPIVFALGSAVVWVAADFWAHAAAAARQIGRRAVLLTGPNAPKSLPEGVKAFSYLPYRQVFPHAAAVVHQAGIGTLAQALRAGRPQLIVPLAFDQPDNARRASALGLARVIPFPKATTRVLASELELLLARSNYAERARAVADELANTDGAACAADELIRCLGSRVRFGASASVSSLLTADLHALRDEYTRSIEPARALAAETLTLERTLSDLVNQAYALTPAEIALTCQTAPPRMPIPLPTT